MADKQNDQRGTSGSTRRRVLAASGIGLGAAVLSPLPLRFALAQSKPYRIGTMQPLTGGAAIIGKTALVGVQMAVDRINKAGEINDQPDELHPAHNEHQRRHGQRTAQK